MPEIVPFPRLNESTSQKYPRAIIAPASVSHHGCRRDKANDYALRLVQGRNEAVYRQEVLVPRDLLGLPEAVLPRNSR